MLTESNIIYETFGINVVPAYMDIAEIPTLHEASDEQDKQSKQQLLTFCHTLLRTRHQQLYMHIEHIEYATASTILYKVNNICMFLVARMSHFFMFTIRVLMLFLCYIYLMLCPCCLHFLLSSGILLPLQLQYIKMNEKKGKRAARSFCWFDEKVKREGKQELKYK